MPLICRVLRFIAATAVALAVTSPMARADPDYPARSVRVIVPFAAGGGTDILTRLVAQRLTERLGQQFYVENIPGAGGNNGVTQAARAAPDGYTVLFAYTSLVVNPSLYGKVPYDPIKDFEPVTLAVTATTMLTVNPSLPANTVRDLVELVRGSPGTYSYASGGTGTQSHLVGEQLRLSQALDLPHVPFSGAAPAVVSVMGGHIPIGFGTLAAALEQVKDGRLRALAVTGKARSPALPHVPTMAEAGYPNILGDGWMGVLAPAGTPSAIIALLNREITQIVLQPDMQERLVTLGYDPVASTVEEFAERIRVELDAWAKVIRTANIKAR